MKYNVFSVIGFYSALLLVAVNVASAASYTREPAGPGSYGTVSFTVELDDTSACSVGNGYNDEWNIALVQVFPDTLYIESTQIYPISQNSGTFSFTFTGEEPFTDVQQIVAGCPTAPGAISSLEGDGSTTLFTITKFTWFPNGGFLGTSASSVEMVGRVIDGVQETGEDTWPFLVFVGVFLAFVIGGSLIGLIKASAAEREEENRRKAIMQETDMLLKRSSAPRT